MKKTDTCLSQPLVAPEYQIYISNTLKTEVTHEMKEFISSDKKVGIFTNLIY